MVSILKVVYHLECLLKLEKMMKMQTCLHACTCRCVDDPHRFTCDLIAFISEWDILQCMQLCAYSDADYQSRFCGTYWRGEDVH